MTPQPAGMTPQPPAGPSIESLLAQAQAEGLRLNNLFQAQAGHWQANFHSMGLGPIAWSFGHGPGPIPALQAALANARADVGRQAARAGGGAGDPPQARVHTARTAEELDL